MDFLNKFQRNAKMVQAVLNTDPISNEKGLIAFNEAYNKATPQAQAIIMGTFFNPIMDAQAGHSIESERIQKNFVALGTYPSQRVGDFMSFANELTLDMNWMAAFKTMSTTLGSANIVDFASTVTVKEYEPTQAIEASPIGNEHIAILREKRFGAAVNIAERWLETNGVYNLNTAIEAVRTAFLVFQADFAYALLANTSGLSTTTNTAATVASTIVALNTATTALITANANKGFGMSPDVPILLYVRHTHKALIDQVMRDQQVSNTSDSFTTVKLTNMVIPVYTFNTNLPTQYAGKNGAMLVLPGRKNIWANFKPLAMQNEAHFRTSSLQVLAVQYWNAQAPAAQRHIVDLQA